MCVWCLTSSSVLQVLSVCVCVVSDLQFCPPGVLHRRHGPVQLHRLHVLGAAARGEPVRARGRHARLPGPRAVREADARHLPALHGGRQQQQAPEGDLQHQPERPTPRPGRQPLLLTAPKRVGGVGGRRECDGGGGGGGGGSLVRGLGSSPTTERSWLIQVQIPAAGASPETTRS